MNAQDRRSALTARTKAQDFLDFYWLKTELQEFCRQHGLPNSGFHQPERSGAPFLALQSAG